MRGRRLLTAVLLAAAGCDSSTDPGSGSLLVTVQGLPGGAAAAVTVSGPDEFTSAVTATTTLEDLAAGTYTIVAAPTTAGAATYLATPSSQQVPVTAGAQASATVAYTAAGPLTLKLTEIVSGLTRPTYLTAPPGDPRLFVVEQGGLIRIVDDGALRATPFLDLSGRTTAAGERGLLSMAFSPQYATNGFFFVYFTEGSTGDILVERYHVSGDPNVAEPTGTPVLRIAHRANSNHNGGLLLFGPDGMLYLGTGDGGGAGDPAGNAQNLGSLLGKLLRIDVSALPYTIPAGNPFAGQQGRQGEIWAYGLRNPWRYAFDPASTELYVADVGQDEWEEINVEPRTAAGLDYGWNVMEGSHCYSPSTNCDQTGRTLPLLEYDHSQGCSITGGFVYRGTQLPELLGHYVYGDLCAGWIRTFRYAGGTATEQRDWGSFGVGSIFSFGEDGAGELYVLTGAGRVYRIERAP